MQNFSVLMKEGKAGDVADNKAVTMQVKDNGVCVVTFDLPDTKVNVLSSSVLVELNNVVEKIATTSNIKGVVITSGKKDNFIAGADVNEIQVIQSQPELVAYQAGQLGKQVFSKIANLPVRVVAAIEGTCLGGGTELALACHMRLASKSKKTKIGLPEVNLGILPGWGACIRLPKLIGLMNAIDIICGAKTVDSRKAWKLGIIDELAEPEKLLERAEQLALGGQAKKFSPPFSASMQRAFMDGTPIGRNLISNMGLKTIKAKTKGKYPAPVEAFKVIMRGFEEPEEKAFERESRGFAKLAATDVSKNLVGIFFAQNESKKMPDNAKPAVKIETVGVLGAGIMGAGIAQSAAYAGYKVVLRDINNEFIEKGMKTIRGLFQGLVDKRKMTQEEADGILKNISTTTEYKDFANCDLVIEAVLENLETKREVRSELEKVISKDFIFATNTSSLSVTQIAEGARNPANVVGVHFFNPVHKMPLVEIVRGKQTSDEAVAAGMAFAMKLGKTTVITGDAPGFVVNRILTPYLREAVVLLEQGVPPEDIEKSMKTFGMPMGPLELMDEVGLDIGAKVVEVLHAGIGERLAPPMLLKLVKEKKLLGKKGGKGFYIYDEKGKKVYDKETKKPIFNKEVLEAISAKPNKKMIGELQDRMVLIMINEGIRCLEEGVISQPSQLDLAMIMGTGFAPFTGGPLRYADAVGLPVVLQKLDWLSKVAGANYEPTALLRDKVSKGEPFYAVSKPSVTVAV